MMTVIRPKQMLIEAMPAGGFLVSQPGEIRDLAAHKFAASTMDEALAFVKREMAGIPSNQSSQQTMTSQELQRYMASNLGQNAAFTG